MLTLQINLVPDHCVNQLNNLMGGPNIELITDQMCSDLRRKAILVVGM